MTKKEALRKKKHLLEKIKALEEIIDEPLLTPEQRLLSILNGCVITIDEKKYPGYTIFMKAYKHYFELEDDRLWCEYNDVWVIFSKEYCMKDNEIKEFIKGVMVKYFKMNNSIEVSLF